MRMFSGDWRDIHYGLCCRRMEGYASEFAGNGIRGGKREVA
jgi:hypothetical protein